jgi:hypothetical protein
MVEILFAIVAVGFVVALLYSGLDAGRSHKATH